MRAARRALSQAQQEAAARRLARRLLRMRDFLTARRIALYWPNDGEIDPRQALGIAWRMGKSCFLPVLFAGQRHRLVFSPLTPVTRLRANRFGILEPAEEGYVLATELDVILLPLVAFDAHGNRIGMGGGYYDATLAFRSHRHCWRRPRLIGLAHELQKVDQIEGNAWDIPLDGILTDARYYEALGTGSASGAG